MNNQMKYNCNCTENVNNDFDCDGVLSAENTGDAVCKCFNNNCRKEPCENRLIKKGIEEIRKGMKFYELSLKELCKCDITGCTLDVLEGICKEEIGIEDLLTGLSEEEFFGCCSGLNDIRKGVHEIEDAIRFERKAIRNVNRRCIQKGSDEIKKGVLLSEKGLCKIFEGLEKIKTEFNSKKCK